MKNKVVITDKDLIVKPKGITKIWSLRRKLRSPLAHVKGATVDRDIMYEFKGIKKLGTDAYMRGYFAGTFIKNGDRIYYNASRGAEVVVIQLDNEAFDRLVLEVKNPERLVEVVNNHI